MHILREHLAYRYLFSSLISNRFGAAALALNLVPVVGLVFNLTSTVGAALWASDLEKKNSPSRDHVGHGDSEVAVEIEA